MSLKFISETFLFHFSVNGDRYEVRLERESLLENWFINILNTDSNHVLQSTMGKKDMIGNRETAEALLRKVLQLD
jgi:hypothetical protein